MHVTVAYMSVYPDLFAFGGSSSIFRLWFLCMALDILNYTGTCSPQRGTPTAGTHNNKLSARAYHLSLPYTFHSVTLCFHTEITVDYGIR